MLVVDIGMFSIIRIVIVCECNISNVIRDVGSVRSTYPTLLPNGVDHLKSKVRLQKLLLGYRVGLKITISDTGMWQSISKFVEDAKKNTGGGFSIFGFREYLPNLHHILDSRWHFNLLSRFRCRWRWYHASWSQYSEDGEQRWRRSDFDPSFTSRCCLSVGGTWESSIDCHNAPFFLFQLSWLCGYSWERLMFCTWTRI